MFEHPYAALVQGGWGAALEATRVWPGWWEPTQVLEWLLQLLLTAGVWPAPLPSSIPGCRYWAGKNPYDHKGRPFCAHLGRQRQRGESFWGTLFYSCFFEKEASVLQTAYTGWSLAGSSLQFFLKAMLLHSSPMGFTCVAFSSFREMTDSAEVTGA